MISGWRWIDPAGPSTSRRDGLTFSPRATRSVRSVLYSENVELSTDQKGAIAESAIVHGAIKLGIGVYRPLSDGERYDLIFDFGDRLERIQCKWSPLYRNVVVVRLYSCRRTATGLSRRRYTAGEIDAIALYCEELDRCFYIPGSVSTGTTNYHSASSRAATTKPRA